MEVCHTSDIFRSPAAQALRQFVQKRHSTWGTGTPEFETFEKELHGLMMAWERSVLADELAQYDVTAEQIEVGGVEYHPVLRSTATYMTAAGSVQVERHLYRPAGRNGKSICPLELRAGIVVDFWTPWAARLGAYVVAQLPPGEGAQLFAELGAMAPSRSSLDRLPRALSTVWEKQRQALEQAVRVRETVPPETVTVALSIDGVMAPMKAAAQVRQAKLAEAGKHAAGPAGYREVGCGTVSLHGSDGQRFQTIRYARMPEHRKAALQGQLQAEVQAIVALSLNLRWVHLADGAETNWTLMSELAQAAGLLPTAFLEIVDFYHACDHLKHACDAIWGEGSTQGKAEFERLKTLLKEDDVGLEKILRVFKYQLTKLSGNRHKRLQTEQTYFHNQASRMHYPQYQRENLPIASGVVEAACKTLVTQRLKCSGMAWSIPGGQAILTLRSLIQSERWDQAWGLWAALFRQPVTILNASGYSALPLAV